MTESEALKQFIPILGRISTPSERATITRNILERIAGQQTAVMALSHKQAGALAWPSDNVKALQFEQNLDKAVDTGEFVSFIHRADHRHFQIEELSAWPDCPEIADDSPLVFWLGATKRIDVTTAPAAPAPAPASGTPEQRRARWLEWYGKGERGAIQRVFERERLQNPKADRSFIGKQIKAAKGERAAKKRSDAMLGQLVRDGKRVG